MFSQLTQLMAEQPGPGIVYAPTRKETEALAAELSAVFPAAAYHAGMAADHAHQRLHLSHAGGKGRLVKKPGRQSQCALRQRSFQQLGHDLDFRCIGSAA